MMQLGGPCSTNQLVINGSFLAKHINFLRTKGTLRSAVAGEAYGAPSFATNIAEVFRYSPESYMTTPGVQAYDDSTNYDSVLSLSPSL